MCFILVVVGGSEALTEALLLEVNFQRVGSTNPHSSEISFLPMVATFGLFMTHPTGT